MADTKNLSRGQKQAADLAALFRARNPLIWIVTREEARVEGFVAEAAASAKYVTHAWDVAQGVTTLDGKKDNRFASVDPGDTLNTIRSLIVDERGQWRNIDRGVWIMRDMPVWLSGPAFAAVLRNLRNLARWLPGIPREKAQAIVILSPSGDVPPELANHTTVIDWPLPDRSEIAAILDAALDALPDDVKKNAAPNGVHEAAIEAAVGLSGEEAAACYSRSLVTTRKIDPAVIAAEKKRIIARERVLEWIDPVEGGLDAVGGLENLKAWLLARTSAYSPQAREYGLPLPKGIFVGGISGCGKTLTAKAAPIALKMPLLRIDFGALKGKYVGESEGNLRKALRVLDAVGRCVVWADEIEKSLQGATSGSADGGVSADALGTFLTWMQERQGGAFVIATANEVENLPPELLRKGRFDEMFFVDLPTDTERRAIVKAALRANGRGHVEVDEAAVAARTENFTGAEIAALVPDALYTAFADKAREITTNDLLDAAATVVPLATTASEKITRMRNWFQGRARPATKPDAETKRSPAVRNLDL